MGDRVRDEQRLAAVEDSGLVGGEPEHVFDALTSAATRLLNAPFAFMTAVDGRISYWKSTAGLDDGTRFNSVDDSFCQYVIEREDDVILDDVLQDGEARSNPSIESMGVRAWAGCPVTLDGQILGTFCVVDQVPRSWTERDRAVLRSLARAASRQVGVRVDSGSTDVQASGIGDDDARRRLDAIRESVRAPTFPPRDQLDLAAWTRPAGDADHTGDFIDAFPISDGVWGLVIGDVCGHGVDAARLTSLARYAIRSAVLTHDEPCDVLTEADAVFTRDSLDPGRFATVSYLRLDTTTGLTISYARAGHTLPALIAATGEVRMLDGATGPPLGLGVADLDVAFASETIELSPGDLLLLYTDGLIESRRLSGGDFVGEDGLGRILSSFARRSRSGATGLVDDIRTPFDDGRFECHDDIAVLAVGP